MIPNILLRNYITNMLQQQYIKDENGVKLAVITPIERYNKMIEQLEEKNDFST